MKVLKDGRKILKPCGNIDDLPAKAKEYIRRVEDFTGVPANIVSVGPDRAETLLLTNPFEK